MNREHLSRRSVQLTDTRTIHDNQRLSLLAEGYPCHSGDLWRVLLTAAAHQSIIEAACTDLLTAPHANAIRGYLHDQLGLAQIAKLKADWNYAVQQLIPD